jgi:hypothetical protein
VADRESSSVMSEFSHWWTSKPLIRPIGLLVPWNFPRNYIEPFAAILSSDTILLGWIRHHLTKSLPWAGWTIVESCCRFSNPKWKVDFEDLSLVMRVGWLWNFIIRRNGVCHAAPSLKQESSNSRYIKFHVDHYFWNEWTLGRRSNDWGPQV